MKYMTLKAITDACHGTYYGDASLTSTEVTQITIDSRKVQSGCLFVPIAGARADGHDFIPQVVDSGALCTLSEHLLPDASHPYILVASCQQALKDMAEFYRTSLGVKVIGITGSVGKTSTKEMIASVLEQKFHVLKTEGNFNNEIGLPLTVFNLTEDHEIAILEMGINNFGEMHRLTKIARPDICVITNIGCCHLEFLKSREGILKAKSEIFDFLETDGKIVLNGDDDLLSTLHDVKGIKPCFFGLSPAQDIFASEIENLGLKGTACTLHLAADAFRAEIPIPGAHMVYNALAGASIGAMLGMTPDEIKTGIESLIPVSGRNHIIETNSLTIIDDCYNANPVSMKASLDVLSTALGRKAAILGDMGELGKDEGSLHYQVGIHAGESLADVILCVGSLSAQTAAGAKSTGTKADILYFASKEECMKELPCLLHKGDTVLVKASHAMDFPQIVADLEQLSF